MIRVVVDTDVVVSAALRDRTPEEAILFIVESEDFEWVVSREILEEYSEVLAREKFGLPIEVLQRWRVMIEQCATVIEPGLTVDFPRDKKDARFLECALAAEADYLLTGDKDFAEARKLVATSIISVSQFRRLIMDNWS